VLTELFFAENAPVILVGTHAEDKACTKEYVDHYFDSVKRKYGTLFKLQIQAHFAISNETQKVSMFYVLVDVSWPMSNSRIVRLVVPHAGSDGAQEQDHGSCAVTAVHA
jgi:hypothetical protein